MFLPEGMHVRSIDITWMETDGGLIELIVSMDLLGQLSILKCPGQSTNKDVFHASGIYSNELSMDVKILLRFDKWNLS
ncbi:MAG TPA: hypothetical protein VNJ08_14610 [Bacteriovoracaceae bacterium]|nr:hypothetical protein [Bacteriovoracaceae bacterium]